MNNRVAVPAAMAMLAGLYVSSLYNYLLFHSLAEIFSIVIACGIFMTAWNSRRIFNNGYLLFIGIAYLFIGGLDLAHTLAYAGMNIFPGYGSNLPTQLWISARYIESLSLLIAPLMLRRKLNAGFLFIGYAAVTLFLLLSIFGWKIFPTCYIDGVGLTEFKKASEIAISIILVAAAGLLLRKRNEFDRSVLRWLLGSIGFTIASELSFVFYVSVYGFSNLIGHFFKIVSYYLIYKAIIQTGLARPYDLLFRDLKRSEEQYRSLFTHMINGLVHHKMVIDRGGNPVDYVFLEVNDAFERLTGAKRADLIGKRVTEVFAGAGNPPVDWIDIYGKVAMTGNPVRLESHSEQSGRWYAVLAYSPNPGHFVTVFDDITQRKGAERALQQSEQRWRELAEAMPQLVWTCTPDGHCDFLSKQWVVYTGLSEPRQLGSGWLEQVHPDDRDAIMAAWNRSLQTGNIFDMEFRIRRYDGAYRWFKTRAVPVRDPSGNISKWYGSNTDIHDLRSAQVALRDSEERFRLFMDYSPTIAWIKDEQGRHVYISKTYENRFKVRLEDWLGKTDFELWPQETAEQFSKNDRAVLAAGHPIEVTEETLDPDRGSCYWWNFKFPLQDAAGKRYVAGIGVDITDRKEMEEALRRARDELELRVSERTAELNRSNKELQDFAFIASHDLQEPLRKIRTFGDMLFRKSGVHLDAEGSDYIGRMQKAAARMQALLESLLNYSRVTTRGAVFKPTDLGKSLEAALSNLEVLIKEKDAVVEAGDLPELEADGIQMTQLFQNLIGNALKFQRKGEPPFIRIYARPVEGRSDGNGAYEIRVEDRGIGFDVRYVDKIFLPFQRLHGRGEYEGTGMGLAICKKIVERHGGAISAKSEPGNGAVFTITLKGRAAKR